MRFRTGTEKMGEGKERDEGVAKESDNEEAHLEHWGATRNSPEGTLPN